MNRKRKYLSGNTRLNIWDRDGRICNICGDETVLFRTQCGCPAMPGYKALAHIDHITPFSKGGKCEDSNFQLLCERCNTSKGAKL